MAIRKRKRNQIKRRDAEILLGLTYFHNATYWFEMESADEWGIRIKASGIHRCVTSKTIQGINTSWQREFNERFSIRCDSCYVNAPNVKYLSKQLYSFLFQEGLIYYVGIFGQLFLKLTRLLFTIWLEFIPFLISPLKRNNEEEHSLAALKYF